MTVEHILISVTVVHINKLIQYDDSCANILERELLKYNGVNRVFTTVHYNHCNDEVHQDDCSCHFCKP